MTLPAIAGGASVRAASPSTTPTSTPTARVSADGDAPERRSAVWRGVGAAAAYTSGHDENSLTELSRLADFGAPRDGIRLTTAARLAHDGITDATRRITRQLLGCMPEDLPSSDSIGG